MPRVQPSFGDKMTHGLCQSVFLIMALNAVFLVGGIAMALLAKIIAYGAVSELNDSFSDLALYVDDWENYLTTFEDVYGFAIMIFGLLIGVFSIAGAFAFWCRITPLVITYLSFIGFSIVLCYVIGLTLVIFSSKDYLPVMNDTINESIISALEGYCDDDEAGLGGDSPIMDLFRSTETATIVSSQANEQMEGCPVYDDNSAIECDEAKQQCASAVIAWLLDYLAPLGTWLCVIATAFVLVVAVAIYFLNVHNLWLDRRRSVAIRDQLGHDTLARDVTLTALKENNDRASWVGLSPTDALCKALPSHVHEQVKGGRQSQFVNDVENVLSAASRQYPGESRSKVAKQLTNNFNNENQMLLTNDFHNQNNQMPAKGKGKGEQMSSVPMEPDFESFDFFATPFENRNNVSPAKRQVAHAPMYPPPRQLAHASPPLMNMGPGPMYPPKQQSVAPPPRNLAPGPMYPPPQQQPMNMAPGPMNQIRAPPARNMAPGPNPMYPAPQQTVGGLRSAFSTQQQQQLYQSSYHPNQRGHFGSDWW